MQLLNWHPAWICTVDCIYTPLEAVKMSVIKFWYLCTDKICCFTWSDNFDVLKFWQVCLDICLAKHKKKLIWQISIWYLKWPVSLLAENAESTNCFFYSVVYKKIKLTHLLSLKRINFGKLAACIISCVWMLVVRLTIKLLESFQSQDMSWVH